MLSRRARLWLATTLILTLLSLGIACKGTDTGNTNTDNGTQTAKWKPKGNEGTIKGTVALNGQAPANPKASAPGGPPG